MGIASDIWSRRTSVRLTVDTHIWTCKLFDSFFQKLLVWHDKKIEGDVHDDKVMSQDSIPRPSGERAAFCQVSWEDMEPTSNICIKYPCNSCHFTTSENEWNRRNTTKLVFPILCPPKSRGEDLKDGLKYFSSVEFYWYQNIVCWNISHWQGTDLQNSRVQVHPWGWTCTPQKEMHEILGSKRDDQFSDPLFKLVQKTC